jgi:glucose/arabinose dehydrogenase
MTYAPARVRTLVGLSLAAALSRCAGPLLGEDEGPIDRGPYAETAENLVARGAYTLSTANLCGGLPRLEGLRTPAGVCVGLVARNLKFPRGVVERANGDLLVVDMGGWARNSGSIRYFRRAANGTYSEEVVTQNGASGSLVRLIDRPSGIAIGPDGFAYVGTPSDLFRFNPDERPRPVLEQVVRFVPEPVGARHPLTHFVFTPDSFTRPQGPWTIYSNVGSASDNCETPSGTFSATCDESDRAMNPRGIVRRVTVTGPRPAGQRPAAGWPISGRSEIFARGLRNSMALAVHPRSGLVLQAENARDSIHTRAPALAAREADLPHEEINVLQAGRHYGWPYCYDLAEPSPEYPGARCADYQAPVMLLPGHSSPLAMRYYTGAMMPASWRGGLLVTLHGGRAYGHRLVLLPTREDGTPTGSLFDVVSGWDDRPMAPSHPRGRPVDVTVARDGSLFLTEDHNGTVLRVFYDPARGDGAPLAPEVTMAPAPLDRNSPACRALATRTDAFARIQREILDTRCVEGCHSSRDGAQGGLALDLCDDQANARRLKTETGPGGRPWIVAGDPARSRLMDSLLGANGAPRMPAQGLPAAQIELIAQWIRSGAPVR